MNSHEPNIPDATLGPRAQMKPLFFECQPSKSRPFLNKNKGHLDVVWVLGRCIPYLPIIYPVFFCLWRHGFLLSPSPLFFR